MTPTREINYSLKDIHIKNFRGIQDSFIGNIPPNTPWIFLTGRNGYGKTCFLQAIFIVLFGNRDIKTILEDSEDFSIELNGYGLTPNGFNTKVSGDISLFYEGPKRVVAYGSSRLKIQLGVPTIEGDGQGSPSFSLFNQGGALWNIEEALKNWYYRGQTKELTENSKINLENRFGETVKALLKLMPNIGEIKVDVENHEIQYFEKDNEGNILTEPTRFKELASGNKNIIAMVGDMIIRLTVGGDKLPLSEISGIVIIDEIDLHLHPEWQKKLPKLLSEIFPKVQFIASTHSPIPFLGAPEGSVFIKVNRSAEEGISIEKLDISIEDLTPNLILSSPIFGFTEIFPVTHEKGKRIRTEDTMEEMKEEDELVEELKSYIGTDKEERLKRLLKS